MKDAPNWLSHKPVITVDYEEKDANAGDAKFITIGKSSWNFEDFLPKYGDGPIAHNVGQDKVKRYLYGESWMLQQCWLL